jgi:hypothetical protein
MASADIATPGLATKAPRRGLLGTALASLIPLLGLVASPFFIMAAWLSFDVGASAATWTAGIASLAVPISCLLLLLAGWTLFFLRRPRWALAAMLAPLAWLPIGILLISVVIPYLL